MSEQRTKDRAEASSAAAAPAAGSANAWIRPLKPSTMGGTSSTSAFTTASRRGYRRPLVARATRRSRRCVCSDCAGRWTAWFCLPGRWTCRAQSTALARVQFPGVQNAGDGLLSGSVTMARDLVTGIHSDYAATLPSAVSCFEDDFLACICASAVAGDPPPDHAHDQFA